jgi:hypothetical protein
MAAILPGAVPADSRFRRRSKRPFFGLIEMEQAFQVSAPSPGARRTLWFPDFRKKEVKFMATTGATRDDLGYKAEAVGERATGAHDETKWALLTTEFWAMLGLIVAVLIAAAISDSLNDVRAWTLVAVIGTGYIVSRGIAKAGTDHAPTHVRGRR